MLLAPGLATRSCTRNRATKVGRPVPPAAAAAQQHTNPGCQPQVPAQAVASILEGANYFTAPLAVLRSLANQSLIDAAVMEFAAAWTGLSDVPGD
jgi:hypothetical protein